MHLLRQFRNFEDIFYFEKKFEFYFSSFSVEKIIGKKLVQFSNLKILKSFASRRRVEKSLFDMTNVTCHMNDYSRQKVFLKHRNSRL